MVNSTLDTERGACRVGIESVVGGWTRDRDKPCAHDKTITEGSTQGALEVAGVTAERHVDTAYSRGTRFDASFQVVRGEPAHISCLVVDALEDVSMDGQACVMSRYR